MELEYQPTQQRRRLWLFRGGQHFRAPQRFQTGTLLHSRHSFEVLLRGITFLRPS